MSVRHRGDAPFTPRRTSLAPGHVRRRPRFIQNDPLHDIQRRLSGRPLTPRRVYVGACVLAGVQGFFTRERPFVEWMPHRGPCDRNPVCRQSGAPRRERQIACFLQPGPQRRLHPDQPGPPVAPNRQTAPWSRLLEPRPHLLDPDSADCNSVRNGRRTVPTRQRSQHPVSYILRRGIHPFPSIECPMEESIQCVYT